jgi:cytochrome c peroxidase
MQVGSDNKTACATCHHQAGQDGRTRNQINPGANGQWEFAAPNADLGIANYPFTALGVDHTDNITGSQGVRKMAFNGLSKSGVEQTSPVPDPVFNVNGVNVRQVTGRQAPSTVNAVFNHRNFYDGRAQAEFNGVNRSATATPRRACGTSASSVQRRSTSASTMRASPRRRPGRC